MTYPKKIADHAYRALERAAVEDNVAQGVAANLECGSYIKFFVSIDGDGSVSSATLRSNGCGYMLASANVLAEYVSGLDLRELHGSKTETLREIVERVLGEVANDREECIYGSINALRAAFRDLRARRVEEFRGEEALICTCFGVTEENIETIIATRKVDTVEDVTDVCNAGGGCGACRMLIQELLDRQIQWP